VYSNPSIQDFKDYFHRDFPFGTSLDTVTDKDISSALSDSDINFNFDLFDSQQAYTIGFLNLSAHFLVMNLRSSSQGVSGMFDWLESSKSVGSVSEGITIPQRILDNPQLSMLSKTNYGAKFLMQILPSLTAQVFTTQGATTA
jgi:hypothetical protein